LKKREPIFVIVGKLAGEILIILAKPPRALISAHKNPTLTYYILQFSRLAKMTYFHTSLFANMPFNKEIHTCICLKDAHLRKLLKEIPSES